MKDNARSGRRAIFLIAEIIVVASILSTCVGTKIIHSGLNGSIDTYIHDPFLFKIFVGAALFLFTFYLWFEVTPTEYRELCKKVSDNTDDCVFIQKRLNENKKIRTYQISLMEILADLKALISWIRKTIQERREGREALGRVVQANCPFKD